MLKHLCLPLYILLLILTGPAAPVQAEEFRVYTLPGTNAYGVFGQGQFVLTNDQLDWNFSLHGGGVQTLRITYQPLGSDETMTLLENQTPRITVHKPGGGSADESYYSGQIALTAPQTESLRAGRMFVTFPEAQPITGQGQLKPSLGTLALQGTVKGFTSLFAKKPSGWLITAQLQDRKLTFHFHLDTPSTVQNVFSLPGRPSPIQWSQILREQYEMHWHLPYWNDYISILPQRIPRYRDQSNAFRVRGGYIYKPNPSNPATKAWGKSFGLFVPDQQAPLAFRSMEYQAEVLLSPEQTALAHQKGLKFNVNSDVGVLTFSLRPPVTLP